MKNVCQFDMKYFPNITNGICPYCGGYLENLEIDERDYVRDDIGDRNSGFSESSESEFFEKDFSENNIESETRDNLDFFGDNQDVIHKKKSYRKTSGSKAGKVEINGVVINHSVFREHRFFFSKLIDGLFYNQCFGDDINSFVIRNLETGKIYNVTAYGKISGHGARVVNGQHVYVSGVCSNNGVIFCKRMCIESGDMISDVIFYNDYEPSRYDSGIFRNRSWRHNCFLYRFIFIVIAILLFILAYNFIPAVRIFVSMWIVMTIFAFIASQVFFKRLRIGSPTAFLGVGLLLTILIMNIGGLGTSVGALLSSIGPSFATLGLIVFGIMLMIGAIK